MIDRVVLDQGLFVGIDNNVYVCVWGEEKALAYVNGKVTKPRSSTPKRVGMCVWGKGRTIDNFAGKVISCVILCV